MVIIGSSDYLLPVWCQAITWNRDKSFSFEILGTDFSKISSKIQTFSSKKMHLKMLFAKWQPFYSGTNVLTHWGRVMGICIGKLAIIGSDNGLSPGRRQAIMWISAGVLLIGPLGTNFSELLIEIFIFSFKNMHLKLLSGNKRPFCIGLNVLRWYTVRGSSLECLALG